MSRDRYALLGLGRARSPWFGHVALWSTSGAIPADFSKCLSAGEIRHKLGGMQPYSALLVEAGIAGLDRDLLDAAKRAGVPAFVIDSVADRASQWVELGATAILPPTLSPADLLGALTTHAQVISVQPEPLAEIVEEAVSATGTLIAVCGPGGTGASTVAIAAAQGFADDVLQSELVVLADLARNGEQAMLHDAGDIVPGIEELIDANRSHSPSRDDVRNLTFHIATRRYRLLLGQRRPNAWTGMPPRAVQESIRSLRRAFRTVICDITADFEGEHESGSADVEERNALARSSVLEANVVVVVGTAGMKGIHALSRTIRELIALGVSPSAIVPVINRSPKDARRRNESKNALLQLIQSAGQTVVVGPVVFLQERPVDEWLRDGTRLPKQFVEPLMSALTAVGAEVTPVLFESAPPERVEPGTFGILDEAG